MLRRIRKATASSMSQSGAALRSLPAMMKSRRDIDTPLSLLAT
jgi:hypothetical protein